METPGLLVYRATDEMVTDTLTKTLPSAISSSYGLCMFSSFLFSEVFRLVFSVENTTPFSFATSVFHHNR